jgi:predicted CXXCH cytochrome family protein
MKKFLFHIIFMVLLSLMCRPALAADAPRNPDSAKECALCHYRWIDTFFIDGRGSDLVPYQAEKVVATAEICFSCHDGSVVDSRARVYNDQHHPINKPPPPTMEIPSIFPLDSKGNMQCATCHTAHGVSSEMGMEKTVFLRASNTNSEICRMCHKDKDGGPATGNHPVDTTKLEISEKLKSHGAAEGKEKNQVICETCHSVHGSPNENFLVESTKNSELCLDCHLDKAGLINTAHDLRRTAPNEKNSKGQTAAETGTCGSCHMVHGSRKLVLWAREIITESENPAENLCISCHNEQGIGKKKLITGHSHPVNVNLQEKGLKTSLPIFNRKGRRVERNGLMSCPTCHDPHRISAVQSAALEAGAKEVNTYFLRKDNMPGSALCKDCHVNQAFVDNTDHDLRLTGAKEKNSKGKIPSESGVCGVCHLVHGSQNSLALWAKGITAQSKNPAQDLCLSCHNNDHGGVADKKIISERTHPVDIEPARKGLSTTLPLYERDGKATSEGGVMTCATCHDPHRWDPTKKAPQKSVVGEGNAQNSFLRQSSAPQSTLCENCHGDKAYIGKTDHDMNVTAPKSKNVLDQTPAESGMCGACHYVHNGKSKLKLWARGMGQGNGVLDMFCNDCHSNAGIGNAKVPIVSDHPDGMLITNVGRNTKGKANYFPMFDNKTGKSATVGDISCSSCHDVHQWNPKFKEKGPGKNIEGRATNSFLRMQTYGIMCVDCHGLDALFRFKYYHDSRKRKAETSQ